MCIHTHTIYLYSLKAKKIPAGRLELNDWLGHYRVSIGWAFLLNMGLGSCLLRIRGAFGVTPVVLG